MGQQRRLAHPNLERALELGKLANFQRQIQVDRVHVHGS
jgi:hypothetical protein